MSQSARMESKKKILVIEDDNILLSNIVEMLEENYNVETAVNGLDGINAIYKCKPDLIICDIALPKKSGYQILSEISQDKKAKFIPFIFLTAKVDLDDVRNGMNLGADDYIFKPFDRVDLLKSIDLRFEKLKDRYGNNTKKNGNN